MAPTSGATYTEVYSLDGSSRCVQETREEPSALFDRNGGSNQRSVKLRSAICATLALAVALRLVWRPKRQGFTSSAVDPSALGSEPSLSATLAQPRARAMK